MILEDDGLIWNIEKQRYYLTKNYVYNELGTDLDMVLDDELDTNNSTLAVRNIKYACDMLFDYLQLNAYSYQSTLYYITHNKEAFMALKDALSYQLFDYLQNGDVSFDNDIRVNKRAIQRLKGANVLHIFNPHIPKVEEW